MRSFFVPFKKFLCVELGLESKGSRHIGVDHEKKKTPLDPKIVLIVRIGLDSTTEL